MKDKIKSIRVFIAITLPDSLKNRLQDAQKILHVNKIQVKHIPLRNMHLTLKFIGNINPVLLPEIENVLISCTQNHKPIKLISRGIGVFPSTKFPKAIWAGIKGEIHKLESLNKKLEQGLSTIGIPKEKRKFQGHLTFARFKKRKINTKELERSIQQIDQTDSEQFSIDRLILFQSKLMPGGPIYTELYSAKF